MLKMGATCVVEIPFEILEETKQLDCSCGYFRKIDSYAVTFCQNNVFAT